MNPGQYYQPQVAQIEVLFAGPLVKDSQVELFSDLLSLTNNYLHRIVWVKELKKNYYLDNGNGSTELNWKTDKPKAFISLYDNNSTYLQNETVFIMDKMYSAIQNVPVDKSPLNFPEYWLSISGNFPTFRYIFNNTASVRVYTTIKNPIFEIMLGSFVMNNGSFVFDETTGLIKMSNISIVDAEVIFRDDLSLTDDGIAYDINFYENEELSLQTSGCINIK